MMLAARSMCAITDVSAGVMGPSALPEVYLPSVPCDI
jgi:hypothetical protein